MPSARQLLVTTTGAIALVCSTALVAGCDPAGAPSDTNADQPSAALSEPPGETSSDAADTLTSPPGSQPAGPTSARHAGDANDFFPLSAGFQTVSQGFVTKGSRRLPHRRVFTVTDVTKQVDGVSSVIGLDQDFDGGELAEQSLELFSVDAEGTVRYVGSYTETYEGGQFVNATDAWLSGVNGGKAGILVPAAPQVGSPSFRQAYVPGEGAATAKVVKTGEKTCVPFRCFTDVAVFEEDGSELKYYAPGVGSILTVPLSGDPQETEELINVTALSGQGLAEISAEALKLDEHARTVSADVYGTSTPAKRSS